ncbi:MAG: glucose-1-phosphate adenylyltransferase [Clostridiales bacterium]|nr:glucose-1-phosphate adenylyltransferase [Clostridiales bacterium]
MDKKSIIAMLLAGGQGSRLEGLTRDIAKPAVSFGGKYRIIDFSLSNCVNSGIDTVGILTQYKPTLLNSYIGIGTAWDLDFPQGGVHVLPPYMAEDGVNWYRGTGNAIYHNMDFIDSYNPEYVAILSGDHIYKMDYAKMLRFHKEREADLTIAVIEVPWEEASRFGILTVDENDMVIRFSEKPKQPDSNLASMGVYIFNWPVLREALIEDERESQSHNDFGKDIIPMLFRQGKSIFAYSFKGYWKDVGTLESYYETSMDLLEEEPELDIFDKSFRILSNLDILAPQYIGHEARVSNSIISNDCTILGEVENSILSTGVFIGEGASVKDSIVLPKAVISRKAHIRKAIVGENYHVLPGTMVGGGIFGEPSSRVTLLSHGY